MGVEEGVSRLGGWVLAAVDEWKVIKSLSVKCTWIASHQLPICCEAAVTGRHPRGVG